MLEVNFSKRYMKDQKREMKTNSNNNKLLETVYELIANEEWKILMDKYRDHKLNNTNKYTDCRECHIKPDLLLIYMVDKTNNTATLVRLGSHSTLFEAFYTSDEELEYL